MRTLAVEEATTGKTAQYVLGLVDTLLGKGEREKRFAWCVGDKSAKTGRSVELPFDAVWESRKLIVEVDEDQHREVTPIFDKKDKLTVSGVHRGEQRKQYDERKREAASKNHYTLVCIPWSRTKKRRPAEDTENIRQRFLARGVEVPRLPSFERRVAHAGESGPDQQRAVARASHGPRARASHRPRAPAARYKRVLRGHRSG